MGKYYIYEASWVSLENEEIEEFIKQIIEVMETKRRDELHISERHLASFLGVSQRTYNKIVQPRSERLPSAQTFLKFVAFIGAERFNSELTNFLQKTEGKKNDKC